MNEPTDAQLMALVQNGDREAFGRLVERYKDSVVNYLTRLTGQRDRAEDWAQETFIRLFQHAPRYKEQGRLLPFLLQIGGNLVRSEERRMRRWRLLSQALGRQAWGVTFAPARPTPQERVLDREMSHELSQAVVALPLHYRVPLVMRDVEEMSYEEIARATGCPEGTVKSRVSRARQQLRERLAPYFFGETP